MENLLRPRGEEERQKPRALVDVTLDKHQLEAARRPAVGAMLLLGEAGHGKTTVALHRLAHLWTAAAGQLRALVLVPSEGLARLLQPMLTRLGADVAVETYDAWAARQARRAFRDLPRRESQTSLPVVARVKRDPALIPLLEELARHPPGRIDDDRDAPPPLTNAHAHRGDLQHLFGDRALMDRLAAASSRPFAAHVIPELLEHTRVQFLQRTERAHRHIDAARLRAVDDRAIDDGTPEHDAATVDVEDYAVLFALDRLRAKRLGKRARGPKAYDVIVIDEAQEFAPLELALIGRGLAPNGTLVVAGDAEQWMDEGASFGGWADVMAALGVTTHETVVLEAGYRCPPEVVAFARAIRHRRPAAIGAVPLVRCADESALIALISREIGALEESDPRATTAVLVRSPHLAKRIALGLKGVVPARLVLGGDFVFHRGADVTTVDQVKGLEFDNVIVADAGRDEYPDTDIARRTLYVAVTRARHGLVLATTGAPSPLVR